MWAVTEFFIRGESGRWGVGVCGVTPKYICNILFLWYRISAQISSPEELTQVFKIS